MIRIGKSIRHNCVNKKSLSRICEKNAKTQFDLTMFFQQEVFIHGCTAVMLLSNVGKLHT